MEIKEELTKEGSPSLNDTIPDGWKKVKLEEVASKISVGLAVSVTEHFRENGVPLIRNQNIKKGYFDDSEIVFISEEFDSKNKNKRVKEGDIVIVRTGSNIGLACVIPNQYYGSQTFTTLIVRPKSVLNSHYFSFHVNSFGIREVERLSAGGGKPNLNAGFLKKYKLLLPPLDEQNKIVKLLSLWNKVINQMEQLIDEKKSLKKWLMQKLLSGEIRLEGFNADWKEHKLGDLGKSFNGLTGKSKDDFGTGSPFVTYLNVFNNSKIKSELFEFVELKSEEKQNEVMFGDIFFTVSSETPSDVGMSSVFLENQDGVFLNSFCFGFRLSSFNILLPQFAQFFFRSPEMRRKISRLGQGSTRYNISKNEIKKITFSLPETNEQKAISDILAKSESELEALKNKLELIKEQKDGLIQQLLKGTKRI